MNEEVERILNWIADKKDVDPAIIKRAMDIIADHESRGIPYQKQKGGGPGRGLFQYEIGYDPRDGKPRRAMVARQRALNFYNTELKEELPQWLKELPIDYDPASLPAEQQQLIFLADHKMMKGADFKKLKSKDNPKGQSLPEYWGKYHNIGQYNPITGQHEVDPDSMKNFIEDEKVFDRRANEEIAPRKVYPFDTEEQAIQTEPGELDYDLPQPSITGRVDEPMAQPVPEEPVPMAELSGEETGLESEFDKLDRQLLQGTPYSR